jgi:hypothetical protein
MKYFCCFLSLLLITSAAAQVPAAKAPAAAPDVKPLAEAPDPLARLWDVERLDNDLCMMSIDLGHGNAVSDFLSVYVLIDTATNKIAVIAFLVPGKADKPKGLAIGFVKVGKKIEVPADLARLIPLGDKDKEGYLLRIPAGVIPAKGDEKPLDLLDCFMKHQLVTFLYQAGGKEMRASTTLSGFQEQYRDLLKKAAP